MSVAASWLIVNSAFLGVDVLALWELKLLGAFLLSPALILATS